MSSQNGHVEKALLILNEAGGRTDAQEMLQLSKKLKADKAFGYARRILAIASKIKTDKATHLLIIQQWALCTSKDVDLSTTSRFEKAIEILNDQSIELESTTDQETLGIAGGIYKRAFEATSKRSNLETSLYYYERGYQQGIASNNGYCAINAAFLYDLLAQQDSKSGRDLSGIQKAMIEQWKQKATTIRTEIIETLELLINDNKLNKDWWLMATLAEAKFGLDKYVEAKAGLLDAITNYRPDDWELETTTRQLARLATMKYGATPGDMVGTEAWDALKVLIVNPDENMGALYSAFEGKIGLALSGGGFRASLYHIGVLARLAELDVLRKVEVLSCVSGGSIIGAHYYLELRNLLQTVTDKDITAEHYIQIVDRIAKDFLAGVQRNIRTRVIASWWSNFKMLWSKNYSRTTRVGELYESEIFSKIKDGDSENERWLNNLYIYPLEKNGVLNESFKPKYDNWMRRAKVPILVLNATTLNTGHNWQFTASWMGESPAAIQKIDGNYRLRRMYYKTDGDEKYQRKIRLGAAVAASSGVPGMFEPLPLPYLYEGKIVRLVDGGVHDNQGICGLMEQDCEVVLISDASGQMGSIDDPSSDILGVPLRANDILMERVRNAEYQDMSKRYEAGLLKGIMFIHMKMDLDVKTVDWKNCEDPAEEDPSQTPKAKITPYNIRKDLQAYLAAIRTDLDSFNDTESYALMTSGYLMTKTSFSDNVSITTSVSSHQWEFLEKMEHDLQRMDLEDETIKLLMIGKNHAFKIWSLSKPLFITALILKIIAVIALIVGLYYFRDVSLMNVGKLVITVFFFVLGLYLSKTIIKVVRYKQTTMEFVEKLGLISLGWLVAFIHLSIFDKMYLKKGKK